MKALILIVLLAGTASAETFVLHPTDGALIKSPACSSDRVRDRILRFINGARPLEVIITGETMFMTYDGETYAAKTIVRAPDGRLIGFWRGKSDAYRVSLSIDLSKTRPPIYFGIIEGNPPCAEKWLGVAKRSKP